MSRRPFRIESLERRMLMAGDVSVAVVRGDLVITGDLTPGEVAESVRIEHDGTNYTVEGLNGTKLRFNGNTIDAETKISVGPVTRDIIVDLKTGDDTIEIVGQDINNRLRVPRNLTIRGGTDVDSIKVTNVEIVGVLNVDGGAGNNTIEITGSRGARDATIRGGVDADTISVHGSEFLARLTVDALGGTNSISIGDLVKGSTSVVRDALIRGGLNDDAIKLVGGSFGGKLTVDALAGTNSVDLEGSTSVLRDVLIRGGANDDTINLVGASFGGKLTVDAFAGTNSIDLQGSTGVLRDALIRGGANDDTINLVGASFGGKLTVDALAGTNKIDFKNGSAVARDALIRGGADEDTIEIDAATFGGKLTVDGLAGTNVIAIRGGSSVARDVLLKGGVGVDTITVESSGFAGKLTIDSGAGSDELTIKDSAVARDVLVKSVSGDNQVSVERLTAGAKLSVSTGGGKDKVRILDSSVTGIVSVSTGGEADDIGLNSVLAASHITINAGLNPADPEGTDEEDQTADRIGVVGGNATNVTLDAGDSGSKDRNAGVGEVGITGTVVRGNLTIKTGHNSDVIGVGNDSDLLNEMDELITLVGGATTGAVSVGNMISIVSGMGFDRLRVDSVEAKIFRIDAGLGADTARINNISVAPSTPRSQLSIKMGNGIDRLTLTNTDVNSFASKLVDGGSEEDTLVEQNIAANNAVFRNWENFELPV